MNIKRWIPALVVGVLGADRDRRRTSEEMAADYTNFLLLLRTGPRLGGRLAGRLRQRGAKRADVLAQPGWHSGFWAWLVGLAGLVPFWSQALYTGPFAKAYPQFGDLSYYVGFIVAATRHAHASARSETVPPIRKLIC